MSLADLAESPSSSSTSSSSSASSSRISLTIPTSLLILPTTAALIGLSIGVVRGGNKARLRFLAENAHRQPKTVQGWYFYTKTRNYRVFFGALRSGGKYALGLGGATAGYFLVDESVGWTRERLFGPKGDVAPQLDDEDEEEEGIYRKTGWRKGQVMWEDGAAAGGLLGLVVGTAYRLPRPLFIRSVLMGTILGGTTSAMQIAQAHIGKLRDEQERAERLATKAEANAAIASITEEVGPALALRGGGSNTEPATI
ncbi:hypothetical protein CI109_101905 [Kwoniella shandongensis]|uniref:Uncharacterized protein n=1 Tax=Kwoniella shandongensis TaxID=1734106 RepID=A0A5M6BPT6_9TREE|nr:uncharacterized protein CI109_006777 [Kwoniella shandongensis]KAA5524906.1 hypothetical protein CI109_006777 [Kwoniella shandongensis]